MVSQCQKCGKQINMQGNEEKCPNCGENPYFCWNCKKEIKGSEKICPVCGFFKCLHCNSCGEDCMKQDHVREITGLPTEEIVDYFFKLKTGMIRRECPERKVPISYAHGKLRDMALKLHGFHTRGEEDKRIYNERLKKIQDKPLGLTFTINQIRELGFRGMEVREVANMCICRGLLSKQKIINKKTNTHYDLYIRVNNTPCSYMNYEKLMVKRCLKCKTNYNYKKEWCDNPNCPPHKNGDMKGQQRKVVERKSSRPFCDFQRRKFIKTKKEENNAEKRENLARGDVRSY